MPAEPLIARERGDIRIGVDRGEPDAKIARRLNGCRCTIGREIARNKVRGRYSVTAAQTLAEEMLARPKTPKLATDPALAAHVTERLEAKDSPMTITGALARGVHGVTAQLSHETIY